MYSIFNFFNFYNSLFLHFAFALVIVESHSKIYKCYKKWKKRKSPFFMSKIYYNSLVKNNNYVLLSKIFITIYRTNFEKNILILIVFWSFFYSPHSFGTDKSLSYSIFLLHAEGKYTEKDLTLFHLTEKNENSFSKRGVIAPLWS